MKVLFKIVKGQKQDDLLKKTCLAEYCRQRGWKIALETVTIQMPKGEELLRFMQDVKKGKIQIIA